MTDFRRLAWPGVYVTFRNVGFDDAEAKRRGRTWLDSHETLDGLRADAMRQAGAAGISADAEVPV